MPTLPVPPLQKVFNDLIALMPTDLVVFGPDKADKATGLRTLTWEPVSVSHTAASHLGAGALKPGALWTREVRVKVMIWDATYAATETLLAQFVDVAHKRLTHNGYRLDGEEWSNGRANTVGYVVLLWFIVRLPFIRLEPTVATIAELQGPAGIEDGAGPTVPIQIPADPSA